MPNWCNNTLIIKGNKKELEKFKKFASKEKKVDGEKENKVLTADNFIPYPKRFKKRTAKVKKLEEKREKIIDEGKKLSKEEREYIKKGDGYNNGGYDWCIENWGTKWGFCRPLITKETEGKIVYYFESAWSPPEPIILNMGMRFQELEFILDYSEKGAGFEGILHIANGEVIEKNTGDITEENYGKK